MKLITWKYFSVVMALVLALGAGVVALMPGSVIAADPLQQWVARYPGLGYNNSAYAIAVDGSGNSYVTGFCEDAGNHRAYATVKYNTSGVEQWAQTYGFAGFSSQATAVAVDSSGNVYVTGFSDNGTGRAGYATVKYNAAGAEQWAKRYGFVGRTSEAKAIALDGNGDIYVTGYSDNNTGLGNDYATIKYSAAGTELWVQRYGSPGARDDGATAIAVDVSGNSYVTGYSENATGSNDFATIKYSSSGGLFWVSRYSDGNSSANAIALDGSGNAYVTGYRDYGPNDEYATLKCRSSDGNQEWVRTLNGGVAGYWQATDIAVDGSGNAYVTGSGYTASGLGYATVKYNTAGLAQWVKTYRGEFGDGQAAAIALDGSGNPYVTGYIYTGTTYDYATLKYRPADGNREWVKTYNEGFDSGGYAHGIAVDSGGNIYVTGDSEGASGHNDYATIKYVQQAAAPTGTSINPASGLQGQCPLAVVIAGTNLTGATAVSFGAGITVSNIVVNSATQITATICIDAGATPGARNVSVTTPGGTATLTGGFTVESLLAQLITAGALSTQGSSGGNQGTYSNSPAVALANIQIQSASLSAKTVTPGTPVTVNADIANKSTVNGSKKVTLYVNGQVETTQGITVNSGGSTKLTFNVSRSEPGDYSVYVDGVPAGSFKVELFRESDGILIFSAVLVGLAFLIGMVMLWRRQQTV